MPKGKKNSATSVVAKTASKSAAEFIKEKAAEPETKSVKPTAEKKKATAPKKAAATKSSTKTRTTKKDSTSVTAKAENEKTAAVTETKTKKAAANIVKKSTAAKAKTSAAPTAKKAAATDNKNHTVRKSAKAKTDEVVIQSGSKDYTFFEITEMCKDAYRGGTRKQIKSIKVYVKAEDNQLKAYYVVNDSISGSVDL